MKKTLSEKIRTYEKLLLKDKKKAASYAKLHLHPDPDGATYLNLMKDLNRQVQDYPVIKR